MTVSDGKTVSIEYSLSLENGEPVDSNQGREPLTYTQGENQLIAGLEQALEGLKAGDNKKVTVSPEDGYGQLNPEALIEVPKNHLPEDAWEIGAMVTAAGPEGQEIQGRVANLAETTATIDFNHPLAGNTLYFDVTIMDVQEQP